jgi:hypothetical protein
MPGGLREDTWCQMRFCASQHLCVGRGEEEGKRDSNACLSYLSGQICTCVLGRTEPCRDVLYLIPTGTGDGLLPRAQAPRPLPLDQYQLSGEDCRL